MKTKLLDVKQNIILKPNVDTQFVCVADNDVNVSVDLEKAVNVELLVMYRIKDKNIKVETVSKHKVPNTSCTVEVKGVLDDGGKSDYVGNISIDENAQQTASFLEDKVLVIGKNIKNHSQPILEINANDVKASHGATTGRVDKNQLYYLMSRGFTKYEAQTMLVTAFFESTITKIKDDKVKLEVKKLLRMHD